MFSVFHYLDTTVNSPFVAISTQYICYFSFWYGSAYLLVDYGRCHHYLSFWIVTHDQIFLYFLQLVMKKEMDFPQTQLPVLLEYYLRQSHVWSKFQKKMKILCIISIDCEHCITRGEWSEPSFFFYQMSDNDFVPSTPTYSLLHPKSLEYEIYKLTKLL